MVSVSPAKRKLPDKIIYEKPSFVKENNPFFMLDVMTQVGGKKIVCKQCSSCHGCR